LSARYGSPTLLADRHDLTAFGCRSLEQTEWLRRYARQSAGTGTTRVFVVTEETGNEVVAYYAWCMVRALKGTGRYPQPVALLARLGVDLDHEGHGLGAGLLQDVFRRIVQLSDDIGCRGLVVHAESEEARRFYGHLVPELEPSPTDDLHLVLLLKDIRRALAG
jgi:GNAT superfamily N-acetyltransferase